MCLGDHGMLTSSPNRPACQPVLLREARNQRASLGSWWQLEWKTNFCSTPETSVHHAQGGSGPPQNPVLGSHPFPKTLPLQCPAHQRIPQGPVGWRVNARYPRGVSVLVAVVPHSPGSKKPVADEHPGPTLLEEAPNVRHQVAAGLLPRGAEAYLARESAAICPGRRGSNAGGGLSLEHPQAPHSRW